VSPPRLLPVVPKHAAIGTNENNLCAKEGRLERNFW
jgi:hypothetical protein